MLSPNIAPKPAALPPAMPALPGAGANTAGGPSFAQLLTGQAALATPPAAPGRAPHDATPEPAASGSATPARRPTQPAAKPAGQGRANEAATKPDAKMAPQADAAATSEVETGSAAATSDDETPELTEFTQLIGLSAPAALPGPAEATAAALGGHRAAPHAQADATSDDTSPARGSGRGGPVDATSGAADDTATAPQAKSAERQIDKGATSTDLLQATSASTSGADTTQAASTHTAPDGTAPNFAAVLAQALPAAPVAPDSIASPASAQLQAPLHSDAFAPELGARVSLLAVDGVQQAELQLNPADMGPVSVQIVVDGGQAQVSFHAAQAETRQALEQSLPDLAAALQGQGLTLSGGGVFQQAPRDTPTGHESTGDGDSPRGSRAGTSHGTAAAGTAHAAATRRTVGLLDTFA